MLWFSHSYSPKHREGKEQGEEVRWDPYLALIIKIHISFMTDAPYFWGHLVVQEAYKFIMLINGHLTAKILSYDDV